MRLKFILCLVTSLLVPVLALASDATEAANKEIALRFYQDLWFSDRTDNYADYVAETYTVHDIGNRKNVTEPAITQKEIADFFHDNATMSGEIEFMVAERDLVATRWIARSDPTTFQGRMMLGKAEIPIINVVRIKDGKIVEFWNHRHDIDTPQTMQYTMKGFLFGILIALIPAVYAFFLRRKIKALAV